MKLPPQHRPSRTELLASMATIANRLAGTNLAAFVRMAWPILNPGRPLVWGFHMDAKCLHLEAVTAGKIKRLLVCEPPGHSKTSIVSICWPVWEWLHHPEKRFICASYSDDLARSASKARGRILHSSWYQGLQAEAAKQSGNPPWSISHDTQKEIGNTQAGFLMMTSTEGQATGRHADRLVIDDCLKSQDIWTVRLSQSITWFNETMRSRVTDVQESAYIVVGQRLHNDDLPGVLAKDKSWDYLCLPAEYNPDPEKQSRSSIGWVDPRTREGEELFPVRFPRSYLDEQKGPFGLGPIAFAAQHNQDPTSGHGNVFEERWWRFWSDERNAPLADRLPDEVDEMVASWDLSFKEGTDSSFVVGQMWARKQANFYLLDQIRAKLSFTDTRRAVRAFRDKWPMCPRWLVEDKANGSAIINELKAEIPGIIAVPATESKEARAASVAHFVQSGNVFLPSPALVYDTGLQRYPWVGQLVDELRAWPLSTYADQVDSLAQALRDMAVRYRRAKGWVQPSPVPTYKRQDVVDPLAALQGRKPDAAAAFAKARKTIERARKQGKLPVGLPSATWEPEGD